MASVDSQEDWAVDYSRGVMLSPNHRSSLLKLHNEATQAQNKKRSTGCHQPMVPAAMADRVTLGLSRLDSAWLSRVATCSDESRLGRRLVVQVLLHLVLTSLSVATASISLASRLSSRVA